jgi:Ran GTPase-activating protein (RanGAP) involved in mRNA processing and transport
MKSDELMAQLCSALAANTHVKDLVLVNCNIGQNGCTSLGQAVSNHPSALDILAQNEKASNSATVTVSVWVDDEAPFCSRTHCSSPGGLICAGVVAQLAKNAVLKNINLEKNCVNQEGATSLAQGLAKNTGVRVIDLMNQKNCRCLQPCHSPHSIFACHCTLRQYFQAPKTFAPHLCGSAPWP